MGRPKKIRAIEVVTVPMAEVTPEEEIAPLAPSPSTEAGLFDDDLADIPTTIPMVRPNDGIPPLDTGLTPDEKQEFINLLNAEMPLAARAKQLGKLARMSGSKTAAVGLRAIQEINSVCGISSDKPREAGPMFVLPPNSKIAVLVDGVDK